MHYFHNKGIAMLRQILFIGLLVPHLVTLGQSTHPIEQTRETHVLNRLGFGVSAPDLQRIQNIGVKAYIAEQFQPQNHPIAARFRATISYYYPTTAKHKQYVDFVWRKTKSQQTIPSQYEWRQSGQAWLK